MKLIKLSVILAFFLRASLSFSQPVSGVYDGGLNLAYNPETNTISGFYQEYSGADDKGQPKFSCVFYFSGIYNKNGTNIMSYYPNDKSNDMIPGILYLTENNGIILKLTSDHGGCWNVRHFSDMVQDFKLQKKKDWVEIHYVTANKACFYDGPEATTGGRVYILKGDVVYVDKYTEEWMHCSYLGKKVTTGWISDTELNHNE